MEYIPKCCIWKERIALIRYTMKTNVKLIPNISQFLNIKKKSAKEFQFYINLSFETIDFRHKHALIRNIYIHFYWIAPKLRLYLKDIKDRPV